MIRPRFDWFAAHYAWVETLSYGALLQWCRTALLPELISSRKVLILGEGDGRFLAAFLEANPTAAVDVVDASAGMLERARCRVWNIPGASSRVRWHAGDARLLPPPGPPYDLIVTNFFLDCFRKPELTLLVRRLAECLVPDGRWLVGDFALPARGVSRPLAKIALAAMYLFFDLTTRVPASHLVDPFPLLESCGLVLERREQRLNGFLSSSLWRRA